MRSKRLNMTELNGIVSFGHAIFHVATDLLLHKDYIGALFESPGLRKKCPFAFLLSNGEFLFDSPEKWINTLW